MERLNQNFSETEWNFVRVQEVLKCKWMFQILDNLQKGVTRPGALESSIEGLAKKVLYERLNKLEDFEIITKEQIRVMPPIVHYRLTDYGKNFVDLLEGIRTLGVK